MEKDIVKEYVNGQSINDITKKYHCGKEKVRRILLENGVEIKKNKIVLTNEQEMTILDLYNKNVEIAKIKDMAKISESKIYKILHKYNVVKYINKKVNQDTKNEIYNDFVIGLKVKDLSKKYKLKETTICKFLKEKGVIFDRTPYNKVSSNIRESIVLEYTNGLNICELHEKYGYGTTTIARWVRDAGKMRSLSDAFTLSANKGRKHFRGTDLPWFSTKNKKWFIADSLWEAVRMEQLDLDDSVIEWEKSTERIPYLDKNGIGHYYVPDFKIIYLNKIVVEEIKPVVLLENETNQIKFNAAKKYYSEKNIEYKIVTENEIGVENIKNFKPTGILQYTQNVRKERKRKLRNERLKKQRKEKRDAENRNR